MSRSAGTGGRWHQSFARGKKEKELERLGDSETRGTRVTFRPDSEIFSERALQLRDTLRAASGAGLPEPGTRDRDPRHARRTRTGRALPLRRRAQGVRRIPSGEPGRHPRGGALLPGREARGGDRTRAPVRHRFRGEHPQLRQQHQHSRGRVARDGAQGRAHPYDQRLREEEQPAQEGRRFALGRRRQGRVDVRPLGARHGAAVRGPDEDEARQFRGAGRSRGDGQRAPVHLARGASEGGEKHHRKVAPGREGARGRPQRAGTCQKEECPRGRSPPGEAR